jgi:4-amino-4-deoxy-L-arabinose transferase-like glycosyltransferase
LSSKISFWCAVILLLIAATLRLWNITTLPAGLSDDEITEIRIAEFARNGNIELFYTFGGEQPEAREGVYHIALAFVTSLVGNGTLGYRLLSVWSGMLTLAMTYAAGKRLFGHLAGLSAMALLSISFWPILLSRQITPVAFVPLLVSAVLLWLATALPVYRRRRKPGENTSNATMLGIILGLGLYIHPIGLLVLVFSFLFIIYMVKSPLRMSRRRLSYISFALLLTLIISMPYLISSIRHPELSGVGRLMGDNPTTSLQTPLKALGGIFLIGDGNALHNIPERPLFDLFSGLLIFTGLLAAISGRRHTRFSLILIAAAVLSPVFLLAANSPDFVNYAGALPILALFFGIGLNTVIQPLSTRMRQLVFVALIALLIYNVNWTMNGLLRVWPDLPSVQTVTNARLGQLANHIDRTADDMSTVVCGWRVGQSPSSESLADAQLIALMMNNKNVELRYVDCYHSLVMTNGGGQQQVIITDPDILENAHPPILNWLEMGDSLREEGLPQDGVVVMDVEIELADAMGQLSALSTVWYEPEAGGSQDELVSTPISFGGNLTFSGYALDEIETHKPGDIIEVVTYWRIDGDVPDDLQLFTHILRDLDEPLANADIINLNSRLLKNRDVFIQVTHIPLPESFLDGEYKVSIGAYQADSGERLVVLDEGNERGNRLFLYTITVNGSE